MELERLALALESPRFVSSVSAWVEHIPFALALIDLARPATLVELGTHMGDSYLAFCQAVATIGLTTRCTAIDTWRGDPQAGLYGEEVFTALKQRHDPLYGRFSRLMRATFDEAAPHFPGGSIDLLHIDGLHAYEAVRHDFNHWLPRMSPRGIILMHDTQVKLRGFGVRRLWAELSQNYPSFEFTHGYGLGMLVVGANPPPEVRDFLAWAHGNPEFVRHHFATLGRRIERARQAPPSRLTNGR